MRVELIAGVTVLRVGLVVGDEGHCAEQDERLEKFAVLHGRC